MRRIIEFGLEEALRRFQGVMLGFSAGALAQLGEYHLSPDEDEPEFCYGKGLGAAEGFYLEVHYGAYAGQKAAIARVRRERQAAVYATADGAGMLIVEDGRVTPVGDVRVFPAPQKEEEWFARVAAGLELGMPMTEPRPLSGGFLHKMYALSTDRGEYAVKCLNPHIMARPEARENYRRAEELEAMLEARGLPILPARRLKGKKMQEAEGQCFYIFDFFEGRALKPEEIAPAHAARVGSVLARIHVVDRRADGFVPEAMDIDWERFLAPLEANDPEAAERLHEALPRLKAIEARRNAAVRRLSPQTAICHSDMDRKNVLWRGDEMRVIDLECLGYAQPQLELMETALCWSGLERLRLDVDCLSAFVRAYIEAGGEKPDGWEAMFDANWDRLYWLKYNVERSLGIGCAAEEKAVGQSEARSTLGQIDFLWENRAIILDALNAI